MESTGSGEPLFKYEYRILSGFDSALRTLEEKLNIEGAEGWSIEKVVPYADHRVLVFMSRVLE